MKKLNDSPWKHLTLKHLKFNYALLGMAVAAPILLSACGGGGGGGDSSTSSVTNGTVNVSMTDAPSCGYDHVYVTVDRVRVNASANAGQNDAGWTDIALSKPTKIDLLSLTNGLLYNIGQASLPAGHYEQVRLLLTANQGNTLNNSIVPTGGIEQPLATPSATQSGYKVTGSFDVIPGTRVDLIVDFDACHSIAQQGNGSYSLKPTVTATPEIVSGSIEGYVDPSTEAGATVYAEQNGSIVKGTIADSSGHFVLTPIVQTLTNGRYDVVIVQPNHATGIIRSIPVLASNTTTISTSGTPFLLGNASMNFATGVVTPASAQATLNAQQSTNGGTYTVSSTNANLDTGTYSMSLSAGAPLVGSYSPSLPIGLTGDSGAAGHYTIQATSSSGATQSSNVNVSSSNATNVNFAF